MIEKARILIVDDEPRIIKALHRLLRSDEYDIISTVNPAEAIELLQDQKFDLVLCDQHMNGKTGLEVLKYAKEYSPKTGRILMTGYSDFQVAVQAINEDNIFYYIAKPWKNDEIQAVVTEWFQCSQRPESIKSNPNMDAYQDTIEHLSSKINALQQIIEPISNQERRISVLDGEDMVLINTPEIYYFAAINGDVMVVAQKGVYRSTEPLNHWEKKLEHTNFFRCHRSYIVNLDKVERISPWFNGSFNLRLKEMKETIPVSRNSIKGNHTGKPEFHKEIKRIDWVLNMRKSKDTIRRTIPNLQYYFQEAETPEQINRLENILDSMYISVLLILIAVGNYAMWILELPLAQQNKCSPWDSLVLMILAAAFEAVTRITLKERCITPLITLLATFTLFFVTIRFHDLLGPAIWTFFFIFLLLAVMRISNLMLIFMIVAVILCDIYITFGCLHDITVDQSFQYRISQTFLVIILGIIALAYHKINANRYHAIFRKIKHSIEKMENMVLRYSQLANVEKETEPQLGRFAQVHEQLILQEKLANIGQLSAGIAHEINNSLGYVSSNFETSQNYFHSLGESLMAHQALLCSLTEEVPEKYKAQILAVKELDRKNNLAFILEDFADLSKDMEDGLHRIQEIVAGLKTFSRIGGNEKVAEYDLNHGIKTALTATRNEIKLYMKLTEQLGALPVIEARCGEMNQVLLNLIINAADAVKAKNMNGSGWIKLSTACSGDSVLFVIEDNGIGIEESNLNKIFDLFYTTKSAGKGTGLGLSVAYDIVVNKHHGMIQVNSSLGVGTTFTVSLPVRQPVCQHLEEGIDFE